MSSVVAKQITDEAFAKNLNQLEGMEFVVRYTFVTGWALQQIDAYRTEVGPMTGDYWRLISTINIEVEQIPGIPRRIFLWINLPPLEGEKHEEPAAPFKVEIRKTQEGKMVPTFKRSIDPQLSLSTQLNDFAQAAHAYYLLNCEQNMVEKKEE
jgi:hypothetical protein